MRFGAGKQMASAGTSSAEDQAVVDDFAIALAEDAAKKRSHARDVYGFILGVLMPPKQLREPYEAFATKLAQLDAGIYVYPVDHLHCTISTLIMFKSDCSKALARSDPSIQKAVVDAWKTALSKHFPAIGVRELGRPDAADSMTDEVKWPSSSVLSPGQTLKPLSFTFVKPRISKAAAFFELKDNAGVIDSLRKAIRLAATDPILDPYREKLGDFRFHVPEIVHSSFARFKQPLQSSYSHFEKQFDQLAAEAWKPVTVTVDRFFLCLEDTAYMHITKDWKCLMMGYGFPESVVS